MEAPEKPCQSPILAAGAVVWNAAGEVLLVRRAAKPRLGEWSIPGGKVEWGETVREALAREIAEETGLSVEIGDLIEVVESLLPDGAAKHEDLIAYHHVLLDFTAVHTAGALRPASDISEARWVTLDGLDRYPMWDETRRIILKSSETRRAHASTSSA